MKTRKLFFSQLYLWSFSFRAKVRIFCATYLMRIAFLLAFSLGIWFSVISWVSEDTLKYLWALFIFSFIFGLTLYLFAGVLEYFSRSEDMFYQKKKQFEAKFKILAIQEDQLLLQAKIPMVLNHTKNGGVYPTNVGKHKI